MQQTSKFSRSRRVARILAIVALLAMALAAASPDTFRAWWGRWFTPAEQAPVTVYPYNFTGHAIQYAIGPGLLGYLPQGKADGGLALADAYVPAGADEAILVRWRYVEDAGSPAERDGSYRYAATLARLLRPSDRNAVLTVRFYPDGEIAARYTMQPEIAPAGQQVASELAGEGWRRVSGS